MLSSSCITSEYDKNRYTNILDNLEVCGREYFDNIQEYLKIFIDANDRIMIKAFIDFVKNKHKNEENVVFKKYISRYLRNMVKKIAIPCVFKRESYIYDNDKEFVEFIINESGVNLKYEYFLNEAIWYKDVYDYYYGSKYINHPIKKQIRNGINNINININNNNSTDKNTNIFINLGLEGDKDIILQKLYKKHGNDKNDGDLINSCIYILYGLISKNYVECAEFFIKEMDMFVVFNCKEYRENVLNLLWSIGYSGNMSFFDYFKKNITTFNILKEKDCVLSYINGAIEGGHFNIVEKQILVSNLTGVYPFKFDENDYNKMFSSSIKGGNLHIIDYLLEYFKYIVNYNINYIQFAYECGCTKNMEIIDYIYSKLEYSEGISFLLQTCYGAINVCSLYTLFDIHEKMINNYL